MHLIIAFCHDGKPGSVCKHRWFGLIKISYKANQPDRKSQMWMVRLILSLVRFALLPIITDIWRLRVASLLVENTQRKLLDIMWTSKWFGLPQTTLYRSWWKAITYSCIHRFIKSFRHNWSYNCHQNTGALWSWEQRITMVYKLHAQQAAICWNWKY